MFLRVVMAAFCGADLGPQRPSRSRAQRWRIFVTIQNPNSLRTLGKVPNRMVRRRGGVRVPGEAGLPCSTEDNVEPSRSGGWGSEERGGEEGRGWQDGERRLAPLLTLVRWPKDFVTGKRQSCLESLEPSQTPKAPTSRRRGQGWLRFISENRERACLPHGLGPGQHAWDSG